jgi:hypothetical protein
MHRSKKQLYSITSSARSAVPVADLRCTSLAYPLCPLRADIAQGSRHVRFVPNSDTTLIRRPQNKKAALSAGSSIQDDVV